MLLLLNIDSRENHVALQYEHLTFLVNRCASTGSEGFCSDKVCAGIHDAEECQDHNSGGLSCSWSTVVNSAPGRCTVAGYALPCNMLSGADQCASGGGGGGGGSSGGGQTRECIWNADYYMCQDKSVLDRECHTFTPATCPITDGSKCEVVVRAASGYRVCQVKKALEPATPPPTNGAGDGTGNEDLSKCSAADYDAVSAKLEVAGEECIIVGMRRSERAGVRGMQARAVDGGDGTQTAAESDASVEQLECLAYFLSRTPNPTTVAQACPCLWFHATEVQPWNDSWMKVKG